MKDNQTPGLPLHFAHANGFPAGSYQTLFQYLPTDWQVQAIEKFAHNPRFPVSTNWRNQVEELIHYIEQHNSPGQPVYGVGHSFGATVTFMAACERPDLFKGVILLDPPLLNGITAHLFRLAKRTPWVDRLTPAQKSRSRCTRWPLHTDLVEYFAAKGLFRGMDRRCIQDYVNSAITRHGEEWRLNFEVAVETQIFNHIPHDLHRYRGRLKCPALLVVGEQSEVCGPARYTPFARLNGLPVRKVVGGHMFPLQDPQGIAALIEHTLNEWEQTSQS